MDGVVLTSVGLYALPKPAEGRHHDALVSAADPPAIVWADSAERAGDDSPGLFELGVTADLRKLQADVL